ncbi:DUF748 domain-containing protein [Arcobacter sp. F2176]|uniref:DUF748 domain-containing protein n=1 Tax=Arcobacter sp. F2176 TaxID=2044511 RepID=UPI00100AEF06|nr:DUF748 domain-containing protein [Arcobacter sp. F2176]RXJ82513.1 hypothetical protein CRU95_00160 [Arcobacter sp. F2176]
MKNNLFIKILLSIFLIYSLLGFFLIPYIAKDQIIKNLDNLLIYKSKLEKISFNPYTLNLKLYGFSLSNNNEKLIGFKSFEVDFSLFKSIHEHHISFKKVDLIKPYVNIVQNENGNINLASIMKPQEEKTEEKSTNEKSSIPLFEITKIQILDGDFLFTQIFNSKKTTTKIHNFNYTFYNLGTLKNSLASHSLNTIINKDTKLFIEGGLRLIPFKMYGKIELKNLHANEYLGYSKDLLNFTIDNPTLNLKLGYKLDTTKDIELYIDKANLELKDLNIVKDKETLAGLKSLELKDLNFDYTKQKISIENIDLNKLFANISSNKNNILNIDNLINTEPSIEKKEKTTNKPWLVDLNSFTINNSYFSYDDLKNKTTVDAKNINVLLKKLSIVNNNITIDESTVGTKNIKINNNSDNTKIEAKNIEINLHKFLKDKDKIKLSSVDIPDSYTSIVLGKNENGKEKAVKEEINTNNEKSNTYLDIGPINIKNGQLLFEDRTLKAPFKTNITKLNGNLSELNSKSSKPTQLKLIGKIDEYGYTKITGIVNLDDIKILTDVNLIFKNIAMKSFTPYSDEFVGRDIKQGKLNLNLHYNITESNLKAQNSVIIDKIELGKLIDKNKGSNLPLELGIALLEDSDGIIDIDLPISGNLDDPQFSIAPIIWKVFRNLIIKSVASPFSLLASILGVNPEEMKKVEFVYGESNLIDSEKESLNNIAKVFAKRPSLALKVEPAYDNIKDKIALQDIRLEELISKKSESIKDGDKYLLALESIYNGGISLQELKEKSMVKQNDKVILDKTSYISKIKALMLPKIDITKEELENLANSRISSIKKYLLEQHKITDNRLFIIPEIKVLDNKKAKYVEFPLAIDIKKK